jgi:tape measure domain-containing protein
MAIVVGGVAVDLEASAAQYVAEMDKAARATLSATQRMQGTMSRWQQSVQVAERSVNTSLHRVGAGLRTLQGVMASFGVAIGVREVIRYADAWRRAEAQLRLVTGTAEAAAAVQQQLFRVAQNLGVNVDDLATIYTRAARNAESLGVTSDELLKTTEALGAAIRLSGTSASEASNALIQLSQAFSSGVLRGDELRSVSEQMPVVLDAIAAATGRSRQEVLNFARDNGLAADLVIESLVRQRDAWVEQAETVGGTVEAAMTRVRNAIEGLAGRAGEAGAFQPLIDGLDAVTQAFSSDAAVTGIQAFFTRLNEWLATSRAEFFRLAYVITAVLDQRFQDALDAATGKLREFEESFTSITREQAAALGVPYLSPEPYGPPAPPPAAGPRLELRGGGTGAGATAPRLQLPPIELSRRIETAPVFTEGEAYGPPALSAGAIAEVARGQEMIEKNQELAETYKSVNEGAEIFTRTVSDGFTRAITGAESFGEAVKGILQSLGQAIVQALIFQAVSAAVRAGLGLAGIPTVPASALGGPVKAREPYLVGERGPELFVPTSAGRIIPNSELRTTGPGGGGGPSQTINIDARGATPGVEAKIINLIHRLAPTATANAQARGQIRQKPAF